MDLNVRYSISFPPLVEGKGKIGGAEETVSAGAVGKEVTENVVDETIFSLKASSELSKAINDELSDEQTQCTEQQESDEEDSSTATVTFINDNNFILTINGKDFHLSCHSDKYIEADVLSVPITDRKSNSNSSSKHSALYIGSVKSNCRFKHQYRSGSSSTDKASSQSKQEGIVLVGASGNSTSHFDGEAETDNDVESMSNSKAAKKKRDSSAVIDNIISNSSVEVGRSAKKQSTLNSKGSNKIAKFCTNTWLFIKNIPISQTIEAIKDFFNPISLRNIYIRPHFSIMTDGSLDRGFGSSVGMYIEFDSVAGATAALERDGESLYRANKASKQAMSVDENVVLSLFSVDNQESVYARGCCILCPKQKLKISAILKDFDFKSNGNSRDIYNILQVVHANKDALISRVRTEMVSSMINSAHDGVNVGSRFNCIGSEISCVSIPRDSFHENIDDKKELYTFKISVLEHLRGPNVSKSNYSNSNNISDEAFLRTLITQLQQLISTFDLSNPTFYSRSSYAGIEIDLLTRLLSFCTHIYFTLKTLN